jgi:2-oxoglutarate ferredoxin oxidoreductase subunit alpha
MTEDQVLRGRMVEKRFRKMRGLEEEFGQPTSMGVSEADFLLVGWGSTFGVMSEAVEILNKDGLSVKGLHLSQMWPFPGRHLLDSFKGVESWGIVEGNYTGQLARLIQMEMQRKPHGLFLKYSGRPFLPEEIADSFKKEVIAQ